VTELEDLWCLYTDDEWAILLIRNIIVRYLDTTLSTESAAMADPVFHPPQGGINKIG
jgi:hypothetical protein